jgi:hypothetical protein
MKSIQKAVDHFLNGEYDKINSEDQILNSSPGLIAKGICDNEDDGFSYQEPLFPNLTDEEDEEDDVDKWLMENEKKSNVDLKLKILEQREMIETSVRNDRNMRPDAIMNKIKES